jgi:membrane protease YdiL (CAAX protease family)
MPYLSIWFLAIWLLAGIDQFCSCRARFSAVSIQAVDNRENIAGSTLDLARCLLVFTGVTALVAFVRVYDMPAESFLVPALWGFAALIPVRGKGAPPPVLGLTGPRLRTGMRLFILTSVVVFPLYGGLYYLYVHQGPSAPPVPVPSGLTVLHWAVYNYMIVAFVEELFFRGYLQGCLEVHNARYFKDARYVFWFPVVFTAFLFALAHTAVDLDPARMVVFFPGLLFGWLRAKTGGILAPVLSHGTANMVQMLLIGSVIGHI